LKRFFKAALTAAKWLVLGVVFVEALSFAVVSATNYLIYGEVREGPKAVYDPYTVYLQSDGVWPTTDSEVSRTPGDNRTIWFFGGSTMRATDTTFDMSLTSILARKLNAQSGPLRYNCLNFGVNGFNSLLEAGYLQKQFIEYPIKPNLVVFYDGANDSNYLIVQKTPYAHEGRSRVQAAVESYQTGFGLLKPLYAAYLASFTRELWHKLSYAASPLDPEGPLLKEFVKQAVARYDYANLVCAAHGAKFILFLQPIYWAEDCPDQDGVLNAQEQKDILGAKEFPYIRENSHAVYNALTEALSGKPYFVNLTNSLCARKEPAYRHDGVHNTDAGRELIAGAMLPAIEDRLAQLNASSRDGGTP